MPTPGERRALIFLAAIAALGVAVRGWRELHGTHETAAPSDKAALAHQLDAVDSAIAAGGDKRRPRDGRPADHAPREPRAKREVSPSSAPEPQPRDARRQRPHADAARRAADEGDAERHSLPSRASGSRAAAVARQPTSSASRPPLDLDTATPDEIAAIPVIGPALARRIVDDRIARGPFGSIDGLERVRGISRALARRFQPYVTFSLAPREPPPQANGSAPGAAKGLAKKRQGRPGGEERP